MNQHSIATASPSSWCVYQFRHPSEFTNIRSGLTIESQSSKPFLIGIKNRHTTPHDLNSSKCNINFLDCQIFNKKILQKIIFYQVRELLFLFKLPNIKRLNEYNYIEKLFKKVFNGGKYELRVNSTLSKNFR